MRGVCSKVFLCLGIVTPTAALGAWQASPPGLTEYIACGPSASFTPIQWGVGWNDFGFRYIDTQSLGGNPWWNYAASGNVGACRNWVRGSIAGGAGYVQGVPSTPKGRNAHISTHWYDFNWPSFTAQGQCGHQHLETYVWGWRYNGSSWTIEFVGSTATATWWNSAKQRCEFLGDGHPHFPANGLIKGFAHGNGVVTINNSPYAVLYTMSRASSHASAGCGAHGCYHRTLVISSFY
jgi:hypothetical protein